MVEFMGLHGVVWLLVGAVLLFAFDGGTVAVVSAFVFVLVLVGPVEFVVFLVTTIDSEGTALFVSAFVEEFLEV